MRRFISPSERSCASGAAGFLCLALSVVCLTAAGSGSPKLDAPDAPPVQTEVAAAVKAGSGPESALAGSSGGVDSTPWLERKWAASTAGVVAFVCFLVAGNLLDYLRRPANPHETFREISASPNRIVVRAAAGGTVIAVTAILGGVGVGMIARALSGGGWVLWLFAGVFLPIGLLGSGGRSESILDKDKGVARRGMSLFLISLGSDSVPLADIAHVRIEKYAGKSPDEDGKGGITYSYNVVLPHGDDAALPLTASREFHEARLRGEFFAEFLGRDLRDVTEGGAQDEIRDA